MRRSTRISKRSNCDPDFVPALYQLGNAYRQLFDLDSAKRCYEKVLARKPGDLTVLTALGNVLKEQDDLVGAAAAYRRVLRHVTGQPLWELWLATLCPMVFHSTVGIDQYRGEPARPPRTVRGEKSWSLRRT